MTLLVLGVLLWSVVHFVPSMAQGVNKTWQEKLGEGGYKGSFSLVVVASIVLMVLGWRSATPEVFYVLPGFVRHITMLLVLIAFVLMFASPTSYIARLIRHTQLACILVWATGHLLSNGDSRSIVLFGGMWLWALISVFTISAREGEWQKAEASAISADLGSVVKGLVAFVIMMFAHPYVTGVALF